MLFIGVIFGISGHNATSIRNASGWIAVSVRSELSERINASADGGADGGPTPTCYFCTTGIRRVRLGRPYMVNFFHNRGFPDSRSIRKTAGPRMALLLKMFRTYHHRSAPPSRGKAGNAVISFTELGPGVLSVWHTHGWSETVGILTTRS